MNKDRSSRNPHDPDSRTSPVAADSHPPPRRDPGSNKRTPRRLSLAVVIVLVVYAFIQPRLNERFGWDLPGIGRRADNQAAPRANRNDVPNGRPATSDSQPGADAFGRGSIGDGRSPDSRSADSIAASSGDMTATPGDRRSDNDAGPTTVGPDADAETDRGGRADGPRGPPPGGESESDLRYGLLRQIGPDRFLSPAGLLYTPGSAEGHRLEHLRRHARDMPTRPCKHGVFDGGMEGALRTVDEAYRRAQDDRRTTKQVDRDRTILTVEMGSRVGYVGGRDGNRRNQPIARRVRLVLEGNRVITAYPL